MKLLLEREPSADGCTIGQLFINGRLFGFTLEDETRAPGVKIQGQTAIPPGRYKVIINKSRRFGRMLPLVLGVENFTGIRMHAGNDAEDTEGCILVGLARTQRTVLSSRVAMDVLMPKLADALARGEEIWLTIQQLPHEEKRFA